MLVMVGETNCLGMEALKDALNLEFGKFQIVSSVSPANGTPRHRRIRDFMILLQPGWDAHQMAEQAWDIRFKARDQPACRCQPTAVTPPRQPGLANSIASHSQQAAGSQPPSQSCSPDQP